jgi:drug/metabolite transporter (DMT)-like permease
MKPLSLAQIASLRRRLSGISASLCLLILIFFFLPWLKISCRGDVIATQSGFQTMTGSLSPSDPNARVDYEKERPVRDLGLALFLAGILIAGFGALLVTLKKATRKSLLLTLFGSGLAMGILLLYAAVGFSAERGLTESDKKDTRIEYTGFLIATFIFTALSFVASLAAYRLREIMKKPQIPQNRPPPVEL